MRRRDFIAAAGGLMLPAATMSGVIMQRPRSRGIVPAGSESIFPLSVAAGGRYLQTAQGTPFLLLGDSLWSLATQATRTQLDTILDDRQAKGYTSILFNAIEHYFSDSSPAYRNREGNDPFSPMTDFASPNEPYFGATDYIYDGCLARNIWPLINPAYLGYNGGSEGWMSEVSAENSGDLQTYGAFLASRYPLAGWCLGGDYGGDSTQRAKQWHIVTGIRSVTPNAIITAHGARTQSAYSLWSGYSGLNLNNIYTGAVPQPSAATEYGRSPAMPFVLLEAYYENHEGYTATDVRRQAYTAILSGACGDFSGNVPLWDLGSAPGNGGGVTAALTHLDDPGQKDMAVKNAFFKSFPWWLLEPKTDTSVVTTSLGSDESRICPARASDGSLILVWRPNSGSSTIDLSAHVSSLVRARFFHPVTGTYDDVSGSPFANSGTRSIIWPGERVLVLDAA